MLLVQYRRYVFISQCFYVNESSSFSLCVYSQPLLYTNLFHNNWASGAGTRGDQIFVRMYSDSILHDGVDFMFVVESVRCM